MASMAVMPLPWWEPPFAGTEVGHLVGALQRLRATFRWKADGLDSAGLNTRIGASALTLGGLLKHLAVVEDHTFQTKLHGTPLGSQWAVEQWDHPWNWPFTSAAADSPAELYELFDAAVARSRATLAAAMESGGLDRHAHITDTDGAPVSLRRLVVDLVEEYGRHTGHADLLREAVDGRVGEDPPPDWLGPPQLRA